MSGRRCGEARFPRRIFLCGKNAFNNLFAIDTFYIFLTHNITNRTTDLMHWGKNCVIE